MIIIKINLKKILNAIQNFLDFAIVIFVALYSFTAIVFRDELVDIFGYEFNICQTQSMKGTIEKFDFLIIVKENPNNIKVGDIVVFFDSSNQYKIIHRVNDIIVEDNKTFFQTKGDNNDLPDSGLRQKEDIYAKYLLKVPLLGLIITFFSSKFGLLVIFVNIWNAALIIMLWKLDDKVLFENDYKKLKERFGKN